MTETSAPVLVLFRNDLRITDNLALVAAANSGKPVIPVFILDQDSKGIRAIGGARKWWLHHSLEALGKGLSTLGAPLILFRGRQNDVIAGLIETTGADLVFWNRRYDPPAAAVDKRLAAQLDLIGVQHDAFDGHLLHEPQQLRNGSGDYYKVYSPFYRALSAIGLHRPPADAPQKLVGYRGHINSESLDSWKLLPKSPDWAGGIEGVWQPGAHGASKRLDQFLNGAFAGYSNGRDRPDRESTTRLSPHLAHGEITPAQILSALERAKAPQTDIEKFRKELAWREFSYHLLVSFPELPHQNFQRRFDQFEWKSDSKGFNAWTNGATDYPLVDASMKQLWQTGWMHNRVRMVVASFLTKHLLIDWRQGEDWFWDTLVDADPANNAASWQWVAGSGADAAPYFRIFNPTLQGEKFDPKGNYVKRWLPDLNRLPAAVVHRPWEAKEYPSDYPSPIIAHAEARHRALNAYARASGD